MEEITDGQIDVQFLNIILDVVVVFEKSRQCDFIKKYQGCSYRGGWVDFSHPIFLKHLL